MNLTVSANFSAAHRLPAYKGKCKNIHGHTWKVNLTIHDVVAEDATLKGFGHDFAKVKAELNVKLMDFDHKLILSDEDPLVAKLTDMDGINLILLPKVPTAENLAETIGLWAGEKYGKITVTVWESEHASASFLWPENRDG